MPKSVGAHFLLRERLAGCCTVHGLNIVYSPDRYERTAVNRKQIHTESRVRRQEDQRGGAGLRATRKRISRFRHGNMCVVSRDGQSESPRPEGLRTRYRLQLPRCHHLYLQSHLNTEYVIGPTRHNRLELPEAALREAVLTPAVEARASFVDPCGPVAEAGRICLSRAPDRPSSFSLV